MAEWNHTHRSTEATLEPSLSVRIQIKPVPPGDAGRPISLDRPPKRFSVGRLLPLVLLCWAALDIGLRFLPLDWMDLNPVNIATRYPGRYHPFTPNLTLRWDYVGELALLGNRPPKETREPIVFSTDSLGFRANPAAEGLGEPQIVVMEGDSYTYGAALSDEDTFPVVLSQELKVAVHNGGRFTTDPERLHEMDWLFSRLGQSVNTVIYVLLEPFDMSLSKGYDQKPLDSVGRALLGTDIYTPLKDTLRYWNRRYQLWWPISPMTISSTRLCKLLSDDRILPNEYKPVIKVLRLPDGTDYLVERRLLERYLHPPDDKTATDTADYMEWMAEEMSQRGLDFWVLLIPEGVSVYGPWINDQLEEPAPDGPHYFDRLERLLRDREVRTVNGLAVLRKTAAEDISSGRLAYYREDHHWNPKGVRILGRAMADALRTHEREAGTTHSGRGKEPHSVGELRRPSGDVSLEQAPPRTTW
jgi:hypothetical protein